MDTADNKQTTSVETVIGRCLASGLDPVQILSKALLEKYRVDSYIREALEENEMSNSSQEKMQ